MTRLYTRLITSKMTRLIQHLIGLIVGSPASEGGEEAGGGEAISAAMRRDSGTAPVPPSRPLRFRIRKVKESQFNFELRTL